MYYLHDLNAFKIIYYCVHVQKLTGEKNQQNVTNFVWKTTTKKGGKNAKCIVIAIRQVSEMCVENEVCVCIVFLLESNLSCMKYM